MEDKQDFLKVKSFRFAIGVVKIYKQIVEDKKEFVLSKQCLRSGTAIGAMVYEAAFAQSKADFVNKLSIALKEANETNYWLSLLKETKYLEKDIYETASVKCNELIKLLIASIITAKKSIQSKLTLNPSTSSVQVLNNK
jgi:four helix bundle protein